MIHAEISIYPISTKTTSLSFYIAKAVESIKNIDNLRYEINSMGTILESNDIDVINKASKNMIETVHNLGINRVEVILKIDSRKDKHVKMEEKIDNIKPIEPPEIKFESDIEEKESKLNELYLIDKVLTNTLTSTQRNIQSFNF